MNFSIVSSGFSLIRKGLGQPNYEEFYREARQRFDLRWEQTSEIMPLVTTEDLILSKNLSLGQFGNGALMQHRKNKNYFLMKTLSKQKIISEGNLESLRKEKKLLLSCNFPYIANLIQCICDRSCVHLLLEFSPDSDHYFRPRSRESRAN